MNIESVQKKYFFYWSSPNTWSNKSMKLRRCVLNKENLKGVTKEFLKKLNPLQRAVESIARKKNNDFGYV